MTLDDIKAYVTKTGFGVEMRSLPNWYWSHGISYAYDSEPNIWHPYIAKALKQVMEKDYGGFYDWDEDPIPGGEYYLCESPFGADIDTGIIMHHEAGRLIMYFQFER